MTTVIGRDRLQWKGTALLLNGKGKPLLHIVPDDRYPGMWRVRLPSGQLTDMVNLARAKDAAGALALGLLNQNRVQESFAGAPPVGLNSSTLPVPASVSSGP
jgi:hypothetical protein